MTSTTHATFGLSTTALAVASAFAPSIHNRTVLITGANKQGIGYTTAEAFASQSPRCLILAGRSAAKVQECVDGLKAQYPGLEVRSVLVDLSSLKSVREAAEEVLGWDNVATIDVVVNNAGKCVSRGWNGA